MFSGRARARAKRDDPAALIGPTGERADDRDLTVERACDVVRVGAELQINIGSLIESPEILTGRQTESCEQRH